MKDLVGQLEFIDLEMKEHHEFRSWSQVALHARPMNKNLAQFVIDCAVDALN